MNEIDIARKETKIFNNIRKLEQELKKLGKDKNEAFLYTNIIMKNLEKHKPNDKIMKEVISIFKEILKIFENEEIARNEEKLNKKVVISNLCNLSKLRIKNEFLVEIKLGIKNESNTTSNTFAVEIIDDLLKLLYDEMKKSRRIDDEVFELCILLVANFLTEKSFSYHKSFSDSFSLLSYGGSVFEKFSHEDRRKCCELILNTLNQATDLIDSNDEKFINLFMQIGIDFLLKNSYYFKNKTPSDIVDPTDSQQPQTKTKPLGSDENLLGFNGIGNIDLISFNNIFDKLIKLNSNNKEKVNAAMEELSKSLNFKESIDDQTGSEESIEKLLKSLESKKSPEKSLNSTIEKKPKEQVKEKKKKSSKKIVFDMLMELNPDNKKEIDTAIKWLSEYKIKIDDKQIIDHYKSEARSTKKVIAKNYKCYSRKNVDKYRNESVKEYEKTLKRIRNEIKLHPKYTKLNDNLMKIVLDLSKRFAPGKTTFAYYSDIFEISDSFSGKICDQIKKNISKHYQKHKKYYDSSDEYSKYCNFINERKSQNVDDIRYDSVQEKTASSEIAQAVLRETFFAKAKKHLKNVKDYISLKLRFNRSNRQNVELRDSIVL